MNTQIESELEHQIDSWVNDYAIHNNNQSVFHVDDSNIDDHNKYQFLGQGNNQSSSQGHHTLDTKSATIIG